jgi:predicted nucleic acid-binding protein
LTIYADTSFFVSLYVEDSHSAATEEMMSSDPTVWFTSLHFAECTHAISQQVFRGKLSGAAAEQVYRNLERDRNVGIWTETAIPQLAFDACADLARKYGPRLGTRTLDSLHVACALELKVEQFWTFDERQAKLAKETGLRIA